MVRKILIVTNRVPYPLKDGGNLAMNAMIDGYHKAGWTVHLLSMNTSRHKVPNASVEKAYSYLQGVSLVDVPNDVSMKGVVRNLLLSKEPEHVERFSNEAFRNRLIDVLEDFGPDVVQIESVFLSSYLDVIKKHSHAVTVLRMHNVEYQIWQGLSRKSKNILKRFYLDNLAVRVRNYERRVWKEYDMLLAITEKDAQLVHRLETVEKVVVAPFTIKKSDIPSSENEQWVGYHIGAMDWLPNQEGMKWFLHHAWPKIRKKTPKFKFYFAGRGMSSSFMNEKLDGVTCMGEVEDADAFIADKKILIVPLLSGGGIRVKILEAMAAGKIVITTSKGIKGIEARPDEHFLRVDSADGFAKAIKWCLENKGKAELMAEQAKALVMEKYEQGVVMKQIITELDNCLSLKN